MDEKSFGERAQQSRERIGEEYNLTRNPVKFERAQRQAQNSLHEFVPILRTARSAQEFGVAIDSIAQKLKEDFQYDSYGDDVQQAFIKRALEKTYHELHDWLVAKEREKLASDLVVAYTGWKSASEAGIWIDQHILRDHPDLFVTARNAKIAEAEKYYNEKMEVSITPFNA